MKCKVCQSYSTDFVAEVEVCNGCDREFIQGNDRLDSAWNGNELLSLSRTVRIQFDPPERMLGEFFQESYRIMFQYHAAQTSIYQMKFSAESQLAATINNIPPITKELINSLPEKLKLWLTFS